jgi:hypothetical protein
MQRILSARSALAVLALTALLGACGGTAPGSTAKVGTSVIVTGRVIAGPTCPVERVDHPCSPRPIVARVTARDARRIVATTQSTNDGTYQLRLAVATYTIVATTASGFPRCTPRIITVTSGQPNDVDLACDTGIR